MGVGIVLVAGVLASAGCGGGDAGGDQAAAARLRIAVVPKGTTHDFWKAVHAGAIRAE